MVTACFAMLIAGCSSMELFPQTTNTQYSGFQSYDDVSKAYDRIVPGSTPNEAWFSVWYERVYAKRDGRWIYLSHRTVHGPTYGPDRQSVSDK
jgi:hypothetical protein